MNSSDILGQLLQSGLGRNAGGRLQNASSQPGLGDLLGGLLGGGQSSGQGGGGLGGLGGLLGGAGGLGSLLGGSGGGGGLGGLLGGGSSGGTSSGGGLAERAGEFFNQTKETASRHPGLATAGGLTAILGSLMAGRNRSMGGALGGAVMGILGMVAMNALQKGGQASPGAAPAPASTGYQQASAPAPAPTPAPEQLTEQTAELTLSAMVAAANADGHIDQTEMKAILGKLDEGGADSAAREYVLREMSNPKTIDELAAAAPSIEVGAQIYAASVLAITADTPDEVTYLKNLASRLGLSQAVVAHIHNSLGLPLAA